MFNPLDGVLVVSLEQAVAAPFCTSRLADAGARVIKIERAEGDFARGYDKAIKGQSAYFIWLNRGKESVVIDIKDEAGKALLHRVLAKADVFIQNLAPGAAERAGFGSKDLRQAYPRLITCDISGYGEDGPYRDMKAYDFLIQAETGLASITGGPDDPSRVGVSLCDIAAGMYAVTGICQALMQRKKTGKGAGLQVSLFDALAEWMSVPLLLHDYTGNAPKRVGLNHPGIAPYGAYAAADGDFVVISIQNEREWVRFCAEVLDQPDLAAAPEFCNNDARVANRDKLNAEIDKVFGTLSRPELSKVLKDAKIAFGALNSVADFSKHPQLRRMPLETPAGEAQVVAPPVKVVEDEFPAVLPVPAIGANSDAISKEFG